MDSKFDESFKHGRVDNGGVQCPVHFGGGFAAVWLKVATVRRGQAQRRVSAADEFPADAGNDLLAVGEECLDSIDVTGGRGAAEDGLLLDEHRASAEAGGLDGRRDASGTAAEDQNIECISKRYGGILQHRRPRCQRPGP